MSSEKKSLKTYAWFILELRGHLFHFFWPWTCLYLSHEARHRLLPQTCSFLEGNLNNEFWFVTPWSLLKTTNYVWLVPSDFLKIVTFSVICRVSGISPGEKYSPKSQSFEWDGFIKVSWKPENFIFNECGQAMS